MLYGNAEENWPCSEAVSVVPVYILFGTPTYRGARDHGPVASCDLPATCARVGSRGSGVQPGSWECSLVQASYRRAEEAPTSSAQWWIQPQPTPVWAWECVNTDYNNESVCVCVSMQLYQDPTSAVCADVAAPLMGARLCMRKPD